MLSSIEKMKRIVQLYEGEWITLRRDVHRYPETGWLEMRTSAIIHERLSSLGYTVLTGSRAVAPEARMGVPDEQILVAHALEAARQKGTPLDFLTDEMQHGLTGVIGILD